MKGYFLDLDGVLYRGSSAIRGASSFVRRLKKAGHLFCCITNHSCFTPRQVSRKLAGMGISVPQHLILTSGEATAVWLKKHGSTGVFAIGESAFFKALLTNAIDPNSSKPNHVAVGLDRRVSYTRLAMAAQWLLKGVPFVGTNPDPSYPANGGFLPECGFFLAGLERMTGVVPTIIGKPQSYMYTMAAARLGIPLENLTMVGDRLDTDILGAKQSGIRSVLVLSGHTTREMVRQSSILPDSIVTDVGHLRV